MFGHAGRFLHLQPGIEYLRKDRQAHRQETFEELARYWAELKERRFLDELAGAVELDAGMETTNTRMTEKTGTTDDTDEHGQIGDERQIVGYA